MYVVCVVAQVKPENIEDFLAVTEENFRGTRAEPGNVRFDVHQALDDPARFMLYEVYREEADFHAHHESAHYLLWRQRVADWMAAPRQATKYESRLFGDPAE